jgi:hypothetical protein
MQPNACSFLDDLDCDNIPLVITVKTFLTEFLTCDILGPRSFSTNAAYPKNVGIMAMDAYFPKTFVKQEDLGKLLVGGTQV